MIARNGSLDGISSELDDRFPAPPLALPTRNGKRTLSCLTLPDLISRPAFRTALGLFGMPRRLKCVPRQLHHGAFCKAAQPHPGLWLWGPRGTACSRPGLSSGRDAAGRIRFELRRGRGRREGSTWQRRIKTTYQNHLRGDEGSWIGICAR
ncbi:hypothetical protein N431DRAFT_33894 [Stipitochalara longipes BDJ]|nr:hypothetical protein N431DRAFT_33894 [Stipitochalara longipes BDJ]